MKGFRCLGFSNELDLIGVKSVLTRGLPNLNIVGLSNSAIKESMEGIKATLLTCGFTFPAKKITINPSLSGTPKKGSHFDLTVALLILLQNEENLDDFFVVGGLGLDGSVKSTNELFSLLLFLSTKLKRAKLVVSKNLAFKASMIPGLEIYGIENLSEALEFFEKKNYEKFHHTQSHPLFAESLLIESEPYIVNDEFKLDLINVKGQEFAKKACIITALGMHNILFKGSAGNSKSVCARRLVYIIPPQSLNEILIQNAYMSLDSKNCEFTKRRVFRHPRHTSTRANIFGGGTLNAKIGEVALADGGALFFDESPYFSKQVIKSSREPLEDYEIHISRVDSKIAYQTKSAFATAQNPCSCGDLFPKNLACVCTENKVKKYKAYTSSPILDRIDPYIAMDGISKDDKPSLSSKQMSEPVSEAFSFSKKRRQGEFSGRLKGEDLKHFCILSREAKDVLDMAVLRFKLSRRSINKSLRVTRSCADLKQSKVIEKSHLLKALSFRIKDM